MTRVPGVRAAIQHADPGCFAVVMATGIMSRAVQLDGVTWLSGVLLGAAIVAYAVLALICLGRLSAYRREVLADAADARRALGFFTLPAASDVLAAGMAARPRRRCSSRSA